MSWKSPFLSLLIELLGKAGYELKRTYAPLRSRDSFSNFIKANNFVPKTVIDIGVADGTPWLYEAFPDAYFVLIEANEDYAVGMEAILTKIKGEYHLTAVGDNAFETTMYINKAAKSSSGLQITSPLHHQRLAKIDAIHDHIEKPVSVRTLDSLIDKDIAKPILIKIDTEGYELDVLRGAANVLSKTEIIIAETSIRERYEQGYQFADMIDVMRDEGFLFFDILDMLQMSNNGALTAIDAVFVRKNSLLWKS